MYYVMYAICCVYSATSYKVAVKTGTVSGAGTDANVSLRIYGENNDTGEIPLKASDSAFNKFEKGRTDTFTLEAEDVGKVQSNV